MSSEVKTGVFISPRTENKYELAFMARDPNNREIAENYLWTGSRGKEETPQLGKRYVCGQYLRRIHDDPNAIVGNISSQDEAIIGDGVISVDNLEVYLGCGSQILATKSGDSLSPGKLYCCGMPMSLWISKALPSSD